MSISDSFMSVLAAFNPWEGIAVVLSVAYLLLVMRQNNWAWYCAFISTSIFIFLFWDASLLMESALSVYYLVMAVYGWWNWRGGRVMEAPLPIQTLPFKVHGALWLLVACLTGFSGYQLAQHTQAALPYLDSFTTWGAVVTTWLVTRKALENWAYWIVVDSAALYMYCQRELYLTAALMAVYLVIVVIGWVKWHFEYQEQRHAASA